MFEKAIEKIKKNRDHEKEIAELKAKLHAAEAENAELRKQNDILEKSAKALTNSDATSKQNYELQKIIENFKKELEKFTLSNKNEKFNTGYNRLFIIIDFFCVPVLKELGLTELSDEMKKASKYIKQDVMLKVCAIGMHNRLNGDLTDDVSKWVRDIMSERFVGCDDQKQVVLKKFEKDLRNVEFWKRFYNFIESKYGGLENIRKITPKNPEDTKRWLEMMITLGAASYNLIDSVCFGLPLGALSEIKKEKFSPHNIMEATSVEDNAYEMLYAVSKQFGLDFSKMTVCFNKYNVCNTAKVAMPPISLGQERDL